MDSFDFEHFDKAAPEKQQAVRNAGFVCFGRNGYQKTSMSEIAEMAGVSKAALFHYFGTKKGLYRYLFQFSCEEIAKDIREGSDDFFECIWIGTEVKMRIMKTHPGMTEYLVSVVKDTDLKLLEALSSRSSNLIKAATDQLFGGINWDKLKPEVNRQMAVELVTYVRNGYLNSHIDEPPEIISANLKKMMGLLKTALYKEEYQ